MPPAIAAVAPAVIGAAGSAAGGKKGGGSSKSSKASEAQLALQKQLLDTGLSAWNPAANYYKSLLSGDPTKVAEAVGPTSDILKGQAAAQSHQLSATMPSGGEANAAQAANAQRSYSDLARLYAGVQPGAAAALGQLAGMPLSESAPNVGAGIWGLNSADMANSSAKGSIGSSLGGGIARGQSAKQAKRAPAGTGSSIKA